MHSVYNVYNSFHVHSPFCWRTIYYYFYERAICNVSKILLDGKLTCHVQCDLIRRNCTAIHMTIYYNDLGSPKLPLFDSNHAMYKLYNIVRSTYILLKVNEHKCWKVYYRSY